MLALGGGSDGRTEEPAATDRMENRITALTHSIDERQIEDGSRFVSELNFLRRSRPRKIFSRGWSTRCCCGNSVTTSAVQVINRIDSRRECSSIWIFLEVSFFWSLSSIHTES